MINTDFTYCKGESLNEKGDIVRCEKSNQCLRCTEFDRIAADLAHSERHVDLWMQEINSCIASNYSAFIKKGE